ncbi:MULTISPECIES: MFS transporter [Desulfovibrio]|uniref:Predicted arabinose efflux permease, MFS family n=3 Tax=Desulfovibrio TaxID=872 RepID=A0AA94HTV2_DESDE|nr:MULTISPECIES: MFS transporter [Desulfovibrio]ATD80783.1 MFS transporter [Desulfovibrio sp. G11]MDY0202522.1 MFS transporter [Desulfovibrio desulfuricans]SFW59947.1 Predicted arabinose efflux permease, MFS family [Desulfovibrio desulfuricans]SPD36326.1 Major Facilitator Superfamily transporter [Desulfovibrio sp. G11]
MSPLAASPVETVRQPVSPEPPQTLLSRDFILLFCMTMFCNSFIAVFYCFEQWLEGMTISPNWRGVLLASMFAMVLLFRPLASVLLLRRGKLAAMAVSIVISSCVMLGYSHVGGPHVIGMIWALRIVQGIALAVFSSCTVAVLVSCIPKGQSARGFAIFSLTMLLPYSIIPAAAEPILPLLGGEAGLFAASALLGLPSLLMLIPLAPRLRTPEMAPEDGGGMSGRALWQAVSRSGLLFVYLACLAFSIMTVQAIFFIKGLCSVTGANPAWFFSIYTLTIILVRLAGSNRLDTMPRYRVTLLCSVVLACCMLGLAWGPLWAFVPLTCLYGLGLGLLYPLLAAAVYDRSSPATRSINSNVMMATFDASGMLAPLIGGMVINAGFGYRGVFTATAISVSLCGCFMLADRLRLALRERRQIPEMQ